MQELKIQQNKDIKLVLALGFFDCVHRGHKTLLDMGRDIAFKNDLSFCVSTFSNNPYKMFNPDSKVINTYAERLELFEKSGADYVLPFIFDKKFKHIRAKEFLDMLTESFDIKYIVCGYDYLFGYKGEGDTEFLESYCIQKGIEVVILEPFLIDNLRVSSTIIKDLLDSGDMRQIEKLLDHPYFMNGNVVCGRGQGRKFNFPTANIEFKKSKMLPKFGVYKTRVTIGEKSYIAVTNVGTKPTFTDFIPTVESHIIDFDEDIYQKHIKVEFLEFLRPIIKFESVSQLAKQIESDKTVVKMSM